MGLLHIVGIVFVILKVFFLNITILNSNLKIHNDMLIGLIRSPLSYFDITPSGQLTNRFSNDLGALDIHVSGCFVELL